MIIDGRKIRDEIEAEIRDAVSGKRVCFISFGTTEASRQFVSVKMKAAARLGVAAENIEKPTTLSTEEACAVVSEAAGAGYDGIVVQLPLPPQIDAKRVLDSIPQPLDIDMLGLAAVESYIRGETRRMPPVARAVSEIMLRCGADVRGKNILVIGRGKLVGEPVSLMLLRSRLPFSIIDVETPREEREQLIRTAQVIISGAGVPRMIRPEMIGTDVVLIDAGTSEDGGVIVGDIDPACAEKATLFTPVPGGVGPVTVACLFANLASI